MEQLLSAVLCLVDIIKDNETLMDSYNREQMQTEKSVQYECKLFAGHLLSESKYVSHFPGWKFFVRLLIHLYKCGPSVLHFSGRQDCKN